MAETNVPTYGSAKEYLQEQKKRRQLARRKEFASMLRGMFTQGKIKPGDSFEEISAQMSEKQGTAYENTGLTDDAVEDFVSKKLQTSPIMRLRERNAQTRASRRQVIEKERAKMRSSIPEMTKSIVTTSLRDADGNPYRRTLSKGVKGIRSQGDIAQQERDARADADVARREEEAAAEEAQDAKAAADKAKKAADDQKKNKGNR